MAVGFRRLRPSSKGLNGVLDICGKVGMEGGEWCR